MPTIADFEKSLLALVMWREDSSDGLQGMTAVGCVIRNRVHAGWNGGDWCAVIEAHNQFSSMTIPGDANLVRWPDPRNPLFQSVLRLSDSIYDGLETDITGGALYYANLNAVSSQWFRENILGRQDEHRRIGTVGAQTFFA